MSQVLVPGEVLVRHIYVALMVCGEIESGEAVILRVYYPPASKLGGYGKAGDNMHLRVKAGEHQSGASHELTIDARGSHLRVRPPTLHCLHVFVCEVGNERAPLLIGHGHVNYVDIEPVPCPPRNVELVSYPVRGCVNGGQNEHDTPPTIQHTSQEFFIDPLVRSLVHDS